MLELEPHKRSAAENTGLVLLRLAVGIMLLVGGLQKAFNLDQLSEFSGALAAISLPPKAVYVLFLFEVVAPLMIIFGILSRLAAGFVVVYMLIALFAISYDSIMILVPGRGHALEAEFIYLLASLAICFMGSGDKAMYPD